MEDLRNPEIFAGYYEKVYRDMYRFALYTLRNSQDAEDAVSETVTDAYASVEKLRDTAAFKAWIFAILSNKCRRMRKEYVEKTQKLPENLAARGSMEERMHVREAFFSLPPEERQLISLKVFGGYKSREIGELMNMNDNTVRSRISRGFEKLRKMLE